jgi:hypothetical protein
MNSWQTWWLLRALVVLAAWFLVLVFDGLLKLYKKHVGANRDSEAPVDEKSQVVRTGQRELTRNRELTH